MLFFVLGLFFMTVILNVLGYMSFIKTIIIMVGCIVLLLVSLLVKPKYKRRRLVETFELLPLSDNVYAIKTYYNRVVFKYVDPYDKNKAKIVSLVKDVDVVKTDRGEEPTFCLYERKLRNKWITGLRCDDLYYTLLKIPEGTMVKDNNSEIDNKLDQGEKI